MSKLLLLKHLVKQRIDAAVEDICGLFETTIVDYEDKLSQLKEENRKYKLLEAAFNPEVHLHSSVFTADIQQMLITEEEVLPAWSPGLVQDQDPETRHIKDKQQEFFLQLRHSQTEDNGATDTPTSSSAKQIKTGTDGETCAEPARNLDPHSLSYLNKTDSGSSETEFSNEDKDNYDDWQKPLSDPGTESEDNDGWKETSEPESGVKTHMRVHTGEKSFGCDVCEKRFNHKKHLQTHMRVHAGEKPFGCDVCVKRFKQKAYLRIHMRVHTGEKPFSCDVCSKRFIVQSNLNRHMRVHTEEKPHGCDVCGKRLKRKAYLRIHMKIHTGEKPFGCDVCGKRFIVQSILNRHMSVHTGDKPFGCDVCGKRFIVQSILNRHIRVHTGEKPFGCDVCGKTFSQKKSLTNHMRVHTGGKPVDCGACGKEKS